ncbi:MAG: IS66 family transposase [Solirubrobacteraceae bacterium]
MLAVVRVLEERIDERLQRSDSTNSSLPPSRDPPSTRQQRRALARERAKKSLRKPGGQPGHEGKTRERPDPEQISAGFDQVPVGRGCGHVFDGAEQRVGEPVVHHKWELPVIAPDVVEYRFALHDPWAGLRDAVRQADAVYADETSWRLRGQTQWLWVGASALLACYRIDPSRSQRAAKALLGEDFGSFVIIDRYAGDHWLDVPQQQLCWAHAIRQFTDLAEREGASEELCRHERTGVSCLRTHTTPAGSRWRMRHARDRRSKSAVRHANH